MTKPDVRPSDGALRKIARGQYSEFQGDLKHLFLVGDLRLPTPHPFVRDGRLEIILCTYDAGDDGLFHWHADITEYEYVIEGRVGYVDATTGRTEWFDQGDLSVIAAGCCMKRLVPIAARTLALKVPSVPGDKIHCRDCGRDACPSRQTIRSVAP